MPLHPSAPTHGTTATPRRERGHGRTSAPPTTCPRRLYRRHRRLQSNSPAPGNARPTPPAEARRDGPGRTVLPAVLTPGTGSSLRPRRGRGRLPAAQRRVPVPAARPGAAAPRGAGEGAEERPEAADGTHSPLTPARLSGERGKTRVPPPSPAARFILRAQPANRRGRLEGYGAGPPARQPRPAGHCGGAGAVAGAARGEGWLLPSLMGTGSAVGAGEG